MKDHPQEQMCEIVSKVLFWLFFFPPANYSENGIQPCKNAGGYVRICSEETGIKGYLIKLLSVKSNILMKIVVITCK